LCFARFKEKLTFLSIKGSVNRWDETDETKKNTNSISDPNKFTNSELNTANVEEKRLTCLYGENHVGVAAV